MATTTYHTLDELQAYLDNDRPEDIPMLELARTGSARGIDGWCGRRFWIDDAVSARIYTPHCRDLLDVHDISTTTGLIVKTDETEDGTYEQTWAAADYQLEPLNGIFSGIESHPWFQIRGLARWFPVSSYGRATVQVTAKWGWAEVPSVVKEISLDLAKDLFRQKDVLGNVVGWGEYGAIRIRESPLLQMHLRPFKRNTGIA